MMQVNIGGMGKLARKLQKMLEHSVICRASQVERKAFKNIQVHQLDSCLQRRTVQVTKHLVRENGPPPVTMPT